MEGLSGQYFIPTNLGHVDEEQMIPPAREVSQPLCLTSVIVVRASDPRPKGLGSMPVPPNALRVHMEYVLVKSVGLKILWAESRVQGTGEDFPPLQVHA
ncbi:uncharacterized protein TNCV_2740701 [Trichonephila clavipes]|nr:uncharacterized protein TNCV_2740701 [Trichonephila clavipes]